jgi:hypothetical protein
MATSTRYDFQIGIGQAVTDYIVGTTAIAGAPLVTIGLFVFAWTTYTNVHYMVPIIGSSMFGAG